MHFEDKDANLGVNHELLWRTETRSLRKGSKKYGWREDGEGPQYTLFMAQVCLDSKRMFPLYLSIGQQQTMIRLGDILRKITE